MTKAVEDVQTLRLWQETPDVVEAKGAPRRALDELFELTQRYRTMQSYQDLLTFVANFRFYSPYNSMLIHTQMPGARFVAPPDRWLYKYQHRMKPNARPLVILRPKGPVMFVFDVSDAEALPDAPPLPKEVVDPFGVGGAGLRSESDATITNAKRDGVRISMQETGSQHAGSVQTTDAGRFLDFEVRKLLRREIVRVPLRYELLLSTNLSPESQYATMVHELAHLYCGHLGTPNADWWPDRRGMSLEIREFEAESVSFLVCQRLGIKTRSAEYLAGYQEHHKETPALSLEAVMTTANLIEKMGNGRLKPRKQSKGE
jgi:hypothetical protein